MHENIWYMLNLEPQLFLDKPWVSNHGPIHKQISVLNKGLNIHHKEQVFHVVFNTYLHQYEAV